MKKVIGLTLVFILLLNGCAFLPEEEELRTAPMVETMEEEYFTTATVERGDIANYISCVCKYDFQEYQQLAFSVRVNFDNIEATYVREGDKVKAGDVLAKLYLEEQEDELQKLQDSCDSYADELAFQESLLAIEQERQSLAKRYGRKYDTTNLENLEAKVKGLEESLYVEQIRLDELMAELEGYRLVAGIDGVVSMVQSIRPWENLRAGQTYITLHSENRVFAGTIDNTDAIQIGDVLQVSAMESIYDCEVVRIVRKAEDDKNMTIHLTPLNPDEILDVGEGTTITGKIKLVTEEVKDVVCVPTGALRTIDGKTAVYVVDAEGMRTIRYIEIGLSVSGKLGEGENMTEVISGLEPGEQVIIR